MKEKYMIKQILVAKSVENKEIPFFELKKSESASNIFILGVFHGDEIEGEYAINKFMAEIEATGIDTPYNIYFLPCLNPDGKAQNTRTNANKIDLNRNYPTKNFSSYNTNGDGKTYYAGVAASEPETQFMMHLVEKFAPVKILSIHSDLHLVDYDGPARDLALEIAKLTGYKFVESVGYPTNGSFGTWAGIEKQIPLITLETWRAKNETDLEKIWQEIRPAFYAFCK